jgi:hypothetical protein
VTGGKKIIYYREEKKDDNKDKTISIRKYKGVDWTDLI